jgi:arylsulfatase A-like enzyme
MKTWSLFAKPRARRSARSRWDLQGSLLVQSLAFVFPNPPILVVVSLGVLGELALSGQAGNSVYRAGGVLPALAFVFHLWFWITAGWLLWGSSRAVATMTCGWPSGPRALAFGGLLGGSVAFLLLVLASWGLYLRSGQFAGIDAFEFALSNRRMMWHYLLQAERVELWGFGALVAALSGVIPALYRWINRSRWPVESSLGLTVGRAVIWGLLSLSLFGMVRLALSERSELRRQALKHALHHRLNPMVTLAASIKSLWVEEKIEPLLGIHELRPIAARPWKPAPDSRVGRHSIIFIAIESLRQDVVFAKRNGQPIMPALDRLAARSLRFTHCYAQSTHSDYSDVCVASSLFPLRTRDHHFYEPSDPWPKTLIYDLLKPHGYATAVISAQNEAWGGMDAFLKSPSLDLFFDSQASGLSTRVALADEGFAHAVKSGALRAGKLDDACVTDKAIAWITEQSAKRTPFFMSLNYQSSHFPYELAPESPRPFKPCAIDFGVSFTSYPVEKTDVMRNAYCNALRYIDGQLERLVARLRELNQLDRTVLVIYGENGEAFHENGLVTHAQNPAEPALRVACVVHAPGLLKPDADDYPTELVDIVPTTLGLLNWPAHPNFQGIDVLDSGRPPRNERILFFHTENPLTRTDALLLAGRWKFTRDRKTQAETLFDVEVDPSESTDLTSRYTALAARLRDVLGRWRSRQLAYYHYPFYYENCYPPAPPALSRPSTAERLAKR